MRELSIRLLGKERDAQPDADAPHLKAAAVLAEGQARQRSKKPVRESASGSRSIGGILPVGHRASLQHALEMTENVTGRRGAVAASKGIDEAVLLTTRPLSASAGAATKTRNSVARAPTQPGHDGEERSTHIFSHRPYDADITMTPRGTASRSSAYEVARTRSSDPARDNYVSRH